jgi:hypothetical protein
MEKRALNVEYLVHIIIPTLSLTLELGL